MDKNQLSKTVHILPLGFEVERAVAPFSNRHPDKVILVVNAENSSNSSSFEREQERYTNKVRDYLEKNNIQVEVEKTKGFDLTELIRVLSQLIRREKAAGNQVLINTSSSGRFASIAAAFAGMAHNITVYYVVATSYSDSKEEREEHGVSRCDSKNPEVNLIPNFQLLLPSEEEALILEYLYVLKKNKPKEPWASPKNIGKILHEAYPDRYKWSPLDERDKPKRYYKNTGGRGNMYSQSDANNEYEQYRTDQSNFLIKFQTSFARNLQEKNYVERKDNERKHVYYKITQSGEYALFLYGISGLIKEENGSIIYSHPSSSSE